MNRKLLIGAILSVLVIASYCEDCSNFNGEYGCQSGQHEYPDSWDTRSFQTPPRGQDYWKETYQDMHLLVGYVQTKYSSDRRSATLTFITKTNAKQLPANAQVLYTFGDKGEQESNTITLTASDSYPDGMQVSARIPGDGENDIAKLELEKLYFIWDNPAVNQPSNYENGQKGAIVEFFGWPYADVEKECDFLATAGYMAAKVFPVQEAILTFDTVENGELNPWWFLYQPVSYRLHSRHGTKDEFKSMINYCRKKGVRIYADAVVNHMAGNGNDMYPDHRNQAGGSCVHWGPKNGDAGSPWWTTGWRFENNPYTGERPGMEFPSVPYVPSDFHCERVLSSWSDPEALNYGWLTGLTDLNTEKEYVRQRIADYLTDLISMGVSGIRIDAAKHISPENLSQIFLRFKKNLGGGELPDDFTAYLEVLFGGEKDLLFCQDNDYNYGPTFEKKMSAAGLSSGDIQKIKIWGSDYPKEFPICGYWAISAQRTAIGLDCHDDQNPGSSSRDMGDKGSVYIKEKDADKHRNFEVELFTRDGDWKIKLVLSSYSFMNNGGAGFPDGKSDCSKCTGTQCKQNCNKSVPYQQAYDPNSTGYDCGSHGNWKEGTYTRVHRDQQIVNAMRRWMGLLIGKAPKLLNSSDLSKLNNITGVNSKLAELTESVNKIENGSTDLKDGSIKLNTNVKKLSDALTSLDENVTTLKNGSVDIDNGVDQVIENINNIKLLLPDNTESITKMNDLIAANNNTINNLSALNITIKEKYDSANLKELSYELILGNDSLDNNTKITLINLKSEYENHYDSNNQLIGLLKLNVSALESNIKELESLSAKVTQMLPKMEAGISKLKTGTTSLSTNMAKLNVATNELSIKGKTLVIGTTNLEEGLKTLNEGITMLNNEAIKPITNKITNELIPMTTRVKELTKLGENYTSFAGSNVTGETKFIYVIDGEKVKEEKNPTEEKTEKDNLWTRIKNLFK